MHPISFSCIATLNVPAEQFFHQILDLNCWPDFQDYHFIPGIRQAEFQVRTPEVVGSRIQVTNKDGSTHVEEIVEWQPDRRITLVMQNFSPPLACLANRFEETFQFDQTGSAIKVTRSLKLYPKSRLAALPLWLISWFLKAAIARHLRRTPADPPG